MLTNDELKAAREYATKWQAMGGKASDAGSLLTILLDHIEHLTTHNRVMQVVLAQLSDKENWFMLSDNQDKDYPAWYCDAIDPIALAERALVGDGVNNG